MGRVAIFVAIFMSGQKVIGGIFEYFCSFTITNIIFSNLNKKYDVYILFIYL